MPPDFQEIRSDIITFLLSLRYALDRPFRVSASASPDERDRFTRSMVMVEEARIRFNSYVRFQAEPSDREWREARAGIIDFINSFIHVGDVDPRVFDRPFRVNPPSQRSRLSPFLTSLTADGATVGDALLAFRERMEQVGDIISTQEVLSFEKLREIVPRQQVAPARFAVVSGKVVLADQEPAVQAGDQSNVANALDYIRATGAALVDTLKQSNCDRRLLDSVVELQRAILSNDNIIKVGLTNLACGVMCDHFRQELPDAVNAMVGSYTSSIAMYVAQFPEWEQFSQRAALVDLDDEQVSEIAAAADGVIDALEENPELSDPEVPRTIRLVREFMNKPGKSAKRAAFAMMRTIENLVSGIVQHSLSLIRKTTEKTVDRLSTAGSIALTGLLSIALVGALGIASPATQAGIPWVSQAADIVRAQLGKLATE